MAVNVSVNWGWHSWKSSCFCVPHHCTF